MGVLGGSLGGIQAKSNAQYAQCKDAPLAVFKLAGWLKFFENLAFTKNLLSPLGWVCVLIWWQYRYSRTHRDDIVATRPTYPRQLGLPKAPDRAVLKEPNFFFC